MCCACNGVSRSYKVMDKLNLHRYRSYKSIPAAKKAWITIYAKKHGINPVMSSVPSHDNSFEGWAVYYCFKPRVRIEVSSYTSFPFFKARIKCYSSGDPVLQWIVGNFLSVTPNPERIQPPLQPPLQLHR